MKTTYSIFIAILLATTLAACSTMETTRPDTAPAMATTAVGGQVQEIMPGMLQGYLTKEEQLDSKEFVLPSPDKDSTRQAMDTAWADNLETLRGSDRWNLAKSDADLAFPAAARTFSCALGIPVTEQDTPTLYMLLRRTLTDIGLAPYSAKNAYQRERPFMVRGEAVCTPEDEEALRKDGSYPSGHTAIGWGWALILSELVPERAEVILARGRSFGESRNVCNAHWYTDVVAGRLVGAAAVARLHTDDEFLAAMDSASKEIERALAAGLKPKIDCEAEAEVLSATYN